MPGGPSSDTAMQLVKQSSQTTASLQSSSLQVSVCGKRINVSRAKARESLQSLQGMVRHAVGMEAHCFCFFDVDGRELFLDGEILDAIDQGKTPLQATLSDHAVHDFEQRREELAQMQWKVMRDQLSNLTASLQGIQSQTQDLRDQFEVYKREQRQNMDRMKA